MNENPYYTPTALEGDQKSLLRRLIAGRRISRLYPFGKRGNNTNPGVYSGLGSRIAFTLGGNHQNDVVTPSGLVRVDTQPGEVLFFGPGQTNLNTHAKPRHVVTLLFSEQETIFNFVRHSGDPHVPSLLAPYRLKEPLRGTELHLLTALNESCLDPSCDEKNAIDILYLLMDMLLDKCDISSRSEGSKAARTWEQIYSYLQENAHLGLSREVIANVFQLSPNYVSTLCTRQTRKSFNEIVRNLRFDLARNYLADPLLTIGEVSHLCGYTDTRYFIRVFKRHLGVTPGMYRKKKAHPESMHEPE